MKGMGGRKSSPLYEDKNNKNLNQAPQVNNNNKTLALGSPLHIVVYFGFEKSRKQAAWKKKITEKRKALLSSPDSPPQTRPRAELHHPQRETVAPSPARLAAPRAPAPSLKRGRRGPAGRAGGRTGAPAGGAEPTPPTPPGRARSIVNKPGGPSPSAAAPQHSPRCQE